MKEEGYRGRGGGEEEGREKGGWGEGAAVVRSRVDLVRS